MQKKVLLAFIPFLFVALIVYLFHPIPVKIAFIPYEQEFLYPRGIVDVDSSPVEYKIKNIDYLSIYNKLNKLKQITEIEYKKDALKLDHILTEDGTVIPLNLWEDGDDNSSIEKKQLTDRNINIRYSISFPMGKKINQLYLGCNTKIIMVDDKFYEIEKEEHKKLILFFANILGDKIELDDCLLIEDNTGIENQGSPGF